MMKFINLIKQFLPQGFCPVKLSLKSFLLVNDPFLKTSVDHNILQTNRRIPLI